MDTPQPPTQILGCRDPQPSGLTPMLYSMQKPAEITAQQIIVLSRRCSD